MAGFDKDLFGSMLGGNISHEDLTQFIAQMNEFTRSAGEATAAYMRLADQGIKPTLKQLRELGKQSVEADKIGQFATKASIARGRAGRAYNERVATHGKDDAEAKRLKEQYDRAQQVERYASKARGGAHSRHNAGLGFRENKDWILREQRREAYEQKNPKAAGEGYRHVDSKAEDVRNSIQDTFANIKESLAPVKENISIVSHGIVEELGKSFNQGKEKIKSIATTISDFTQGIVGGFQLRKEDKMAEKAQKEASKNPTAQESSSEAPLAKEAEEAQKNAESIVKSAEEAKSAEKSVSESEQPTETPLSKEAEVAQKSAEDIAKSAEDAKKAEESVSANNPSTDAGKKAVVDVGNEQPTGNDIGVEQKKEQLKDLGEQAQKTGEIIKNSVDNSIKTPPKGTPFINVDEEIKKKEEELKQLEKEASKMGTYQKNAQGVNVFVPDKDAVEIIEQVKKELEELKKLRDEFNKEQAEKNSNSAIDAEIKSIDEQIKAKRDEYKELEKLAKDIYSKDPKKEKSPALKAVRQQISAKKQEIDDLYDKKETFAKQKEKEKKEKEQPKVQPQQETKPKEETKLKEEKPQKTNAEKRKALIEKGEYRFDDKGNLLPSAKEKNKGKSESESPLKDIHSYDALVAKIEEVKDKANALRTILTSGKSINFADDINELLALEKELKALESAKKKIDSEDKTPIGGFTPNDYQELVGAIDVYKKNIAEISERMQSGKSTNFQQDKEDLATLQTELKKFEQTKAQIDKGTNDNNESTQIQGILGLLKETLSTKLQLAKEKSSIISSSDMQETISNISSLKGRLKDLGAMWKEVASNSAIFNAIKTLGNIAKTVGTAIGTGLVKGFQSAWEGAKQLASTIMNLANSAFNALKSAISTTLGNMQKLVSGGFNAVRNGASAVKKGFETVKNTMHSLVKKGTPNLLKSFSSLKSMLMRRIKRTFISSIFNQAKEGLQQLAKSSKDFNQSMSNIKNNAKQVAGNLAITLGNLIQTVEPVLTTLLGWLNKVFEAINGLFAMISGKKTMMVAKKGTDDYAKSLKGASKSAKDLNHQLYGFDEITRQEDNSSNGGAGKIGYESANIEDRLGSINDFFKQMLEAFKAGEFQKVGSLIAEQLNNVTKKLNDWVVGLRSKATKWSKNIAEIFNGVFANKELFKNLGKLIGNGLNLAFDVVNTFLKTFDFAEMGKSLSDSINSLFDTIEWDMVGETIANYFSSIWKFIGNLLASIDWQKLGYDLSIAIGSFFDNLDWESFKLMWSNGINGVFSMLWTIIDGIDWAKVATDISDNLTDLVTNRIDWDVIKGALIAAVKGLQDGFHVLANSDFFINLATNLGETFGGILNNINWEQLASDILIGLSKLRTAFWSLVEGLDLPTLATKLAGAVNGLLDNPEVKQSWEDSREKAKTGINNIIKAFKNLVDPENGIKFGEIGSEIGKGVGDLLKDVDWTTLAESIGLGVSGLVEAFGNLLVGLDLPNVAIKIADGINALFDPSKGGAKFDDALTAVTNGVNSLIQGFANLTNPETGINFSGIASTLAEKINDLIHNTDWATLLSTIAGLKVDLYDALFQAIGDIDWETLGTKIATAINDLFTEERLKSLGENIGKAVTGVLEGITSLISDIDWGKVGSGIIEFIKNIDWGAVLTNIVNLLLEAVKGIGSLITGLWNAIFGGGGAEDVEIPQVISDEMMEKLKAQMGEAGKELAGYLQDSLAKSLEGAGTEYESARQLFIDSISMIGIGAQDEWEATLTKLDVPPERIAMLASQVGDLFAVLEMPDATADQIREAFKQNGIWITSGLAEAFVGAGKEDVANAMQLLGMGVDEETLRMLDMTNLNENLTKYMNDTGTKIEDVAKILMSDNKDELVKLATSAGIEIGDNLGSVTPEALKKALLEGKKSVQEASDELAKIAGQTENKADIGKNSQEAGSESAEKLAKGQEEKKGEVETATQSNIDVVKDKYEALPNEVKPYAEQLMEYITTALMDKDGTVKAAIESVAQAAVDRAKEILSGQAGIEIATTFLNGIRDGINSDNGKADGVKNTISILANGALTIAETKLNFAQGFAIGKNMIVGIYKGFSSYSQALVDFIAYVCNVCADTARDILGIHSPSKVFAEIGAYTMEGMQIGLESQGENAIATVADVANAITQAGEKASLENVMGDGLDNVASKLERIVDIFSDMADVVASMGGLQIPTLASGRTIPYSTQLGGSTYGNNMASASIDENAIENAFYSAITRAMENSDNSQNVNVYLDGRQIADSVTKYQRRQARAMGV